MFQHGRQFYGLGLRSVQVSFENVFVGSKSLKNDTIFCKNLNVTLKN